MEAGQLSGVLAECAERLGVPGVSAAIHHRGAVALAAHGITSIENPLTVDDRTLFLSGSIGKTFTATAMMRLAERGAVEFDAPVRRYLPDLKLKDERTAANVTVLQLFNHTAGWSGDFNADTGEGDDALARYVERMSELDQDNPLGRVVSYNNTSLSLAGRLIEIVCGTTYETAVADLLLRPLGLDDTFYFPRDVMTRRFAMGHTKHPDGRLSVARPWGDSRGGNPAGGMSTTAADLIAWARFHLGDGRTATGERLLSAESVRRMQQPTAHMPGSALGDHVGISWLIRDVDGVRLVEHGGTMIGQHAQLTLVPERDLAIAVLTNSSPNGATLNRELVRHLLSDAEGIDERDPRPVSRTQVAEYVGTYETDSSICVVTSPGGDLNVTVELKPQALADYGLDPDDAVEPPVPLGLLDDTGDRYIVCGGPAMGMRGYFTRDERGTVVGIHLGGRLARRVATAVKEAR